MSSDNPRSHHARRKREKEARENKSKVYSGETLKEFFAEVDEKVTPAELETLLKVGFEAIKDEELIELHDAVEKEAAIEEMNEIIKEIEEEKVLEFVKPEKKVAKKKTRKKRTKKKKAEETANKQGE